MKDLSILILSRRARAGMLARLLAVLTPQVKPSVEVLIGITDGQDCIATKRNQMLDAARGRYLCACDDDDLVDATYINQLLAGIATGADCVTFKVERFEDGRRIGEAIHSLRYSTYSDNRQGGDRRVFYRPPNHLTPVRADLARAVRFSPAAPMEDIVFALRLHPLLKTEHHIDAHLYRYLYVTPKRRGAGQ